MSAYVRWSLAGLPAALLLMVASPPLLAILAMLLLVGPAPRHLEQLGFVQSIALVLLIVGTMSLLDGEATAIAWITAGLGVAALGVVRFRRESERSPQRGIRVEGPWPPGTHEAATAVALSLVPAVLMLTDVSSSVAAIYEGIPTGVLALGAVAVAAVPLLFNTTALRTPVRAFCAFVLTALALVPSVALSFFLLPSAVVLAVSALADGIGRRAASA